MTYMYSIAMVHALHVAEYSSPRGHACVNILSETITSEQAIYTNNGLSYASSILTYEKQLFFGNSPSRVYIKYIPVYIVNHSCASVGYSLVFFGSYDASSNQ